MKKFNYLVIIMLLIPVLMSAQPSPMSNVKTQLDAMFSGLDKTKVPTGFLWDTAVNLIEADDYDGSLLTDSNYVSLPIMGDMLQSINSASVGADTICVHAALSRIQRNSSSQSPMVGILFQTYNYIVANALSDNLINYSAGVVSDAYVNGIWQNPYGEEVLFGSAIGNDGVVSQNATFTITNIDSLSTQTFQNIQFDPGDGNGYRNVSLNGTISVVYPETGCAETRLKVTVDGHIYQSHGLINIVDSYAPHQSGVHSLPEYTYAEKSVLFQGLSYKARIVYKNSVSFSKRPLIVSEGFDPWRLDPKSSSNDFSGFTNIESLVDKGPGRTLFNSYDVFYVDWYDCGADIRANAEVLKEVIRWVNARNQSGEPNVVLGQSMGGLIARYALRDMELQNEPHNTTLFISHDVPYLGANVSPGLMYTYWDLLDVVNELGLNYIADSSGELSQLGDYSSVKQMLPLYIGFDYSRDNSAYQDIQNILYNMGFPIGDIGKSIENVAIINGGIYSSGTLSRYNNGDVFFATGISFESYGLLSLLFSILADKFTSAILIPGPGLFEWIYMARPFLNNGEIVHLSRWSYKKNFLWTGIIKEFILKDVNHKSPDSGIALDGVSGSFFPLETSLLNKDTLMLVPTASAMCMPYDYSRDFLANKPVARIETPFDSYVLPDTTTSHISFYPQVSGWLDLITNNTIVGPDLAETGDVFSISGPNAFSFSWSTSNSYIATISPSGELTVNHDGVVEVVATYNVGNSYVTKRKKVLTCIPRMMLSSTQSGNTYSVEAEISDLNVREFLKETGLKDSLYYKWSLQVGDSPIETVINRDTVFTVSLSDSIYSATVFLSVMLNGREGETYTKIVRRNDYFIWNIQEIHKSSSGITFSRYRPMRFPPEVGIPHFMISRNPDNETESIQFSHISVLGHVFYGTEGQYTPPLSNISTDYLSFDIFSDSEVFGYVENMIPQFVQIMLEVKAYDEDGRIIQRISIPVIYDSASYPPHI